MNVFNVRLNALFESEGFSQQDAVKRIEAETGERIPQTTFDGYLKKTEARATTLAALARYYKVSMEWLSGSSDDKTPCDELAKRAAPEDLKQAIALMIEMPKEQRDEITSLIKYKHAQWKALMNLIQTMNRVDRNGTLPARVKELSGIDPSTLDSISDIIGNDLFGNGDTQGRNEQIGINN